MDKATILIVDDESMSLDILEGYLTPTGHKLILVKSGFKALDHLDQNQIDLVVLDVMMPRMDGFQVCQRIKALWPKIPIILITAFWDAEQRIRGHEAGAEGFLTKPINSRDLREQVSLFLEK